MEDNKRLIDVIYALQQIEVGENENGGQFQTDSSHIKDFLNVLPTVDAVEVVHARWERFEEISGNIGLSCSACGWKDYHHGRYKGNWLNYCPLCGAKMDGEKNNEK